MPVRKRFWAEVFLGSVSAVLLVVTLIRPDWIEVAFGVEPDGGSGALEWGIVALLAVTTVVLSLLARYEWLRLSSVGSQ